MLLLRSQMELYWYLIIEINYIYNNIFYSIKYFLININLLI
jgi:hypothetical protein